MKVSNKKYQKWTNQLLREEALKYKTRSSFMRSNNPAYKSASARGKEFFNDICSHMIAGKFSTPQLILKLILEDLFGEECSYNARGVIPRLELDIYFDKFSLAFEYNGKFWHENRKEQDNFKQKLCDSMGINLFVLSDARENYYEEDIKLQIIKILPKINKITGLKITKKKVRSINCESVFDFILNTQDTEKIKEKIRLCSSVLEFSKKM